MPTLKPILRFVSCLLLIPMFYEANNKNYDKANYYGILSIILWL